MRLVILIFFLALTARLLYLNQIKDDYLFHYPIVDSGAYDYGGIRTADGTLTDEAIGNFHRIPFYRLFLSSIYKISGHNVYLARFIQAIIGALSACLIFLLGDAIFDRRVGLLSGVVTSLYWPLIAFGAKFLPVNLAVFFIVLAIFSFQKAISSGKIPWLIVSGMSFSLASLARSNILLALPIFAMISFFVFFIKISFKKSIIYTMLFCLSFTVVIAPSILKIYGEKKEIMPVQSNYGVGLYFGADLDRINIKPGWAWRNLMRELLDKDMIHANERNLYFLQKTKDEILTNPTKFAGNLLSKFYIFMNSYEFSPRESINYFREKSSFLSLPLFNFGSIAALAILGMLLAWKDLRASAIAIYSYVFCYFISIIPFMPLARYRLPIVPPLIIFASFAGLKIFDMFTQKRWRSLRTCAVVVLPICILTNTNAIHEYTSSFSRPDYHKGRAYLKQNGRERDAILEFKKALCKHPDDPDIYEAMGYAYVRQGNLEKAEFSYKKALDIDGRFPKVLNSLGVIYAKQGKLESAKGVFEKIVTEFPLESTNAYINLGNCYKMEGDYKMAEKQYQRALLIDPENPNVLNKMWLLYEEINDPRSKKTKKMYEKALKKLEHSA